MWSQLAVAVIFAHAAYLLFQMCGGLLAIRHPLWLAPHLLAVAWGVGIVAVRGSCPATRLEKALWVKAGETPYSESFLDRYLFGTFLPDGTQPWVYALHLAVIVIIYAALLRRATRVRPGASRRLAGAEQPS